MTTKSLRPTRSEISRGTLPLVAALLAAGLLTGCGSSDDEPFQDFVGLWEIDFAASKFPLNCPAPNMASSGELPFWNQVVIERGTLTDLIETSGTCPMKMDVKGGVAIAAVVDPDPFTGASPVCRLDASNEVSVIFADIRPSLELRVLKPEKGKAPRAQLVSGTQATTLTWVNVDAQGMETPDPACTYIPHVELTKVAQF